MFSLLRGIQSKGKDSDNFRLRYSQHFGWTLGLDTNEEVSVFDFKKGKLSLLGCNKALDGQMAGDQACAFIRESYGLRSLYFGTTQMDKPHCVMRNNEA